MGRLGMSEADGIECLVMLPFAEQQRQQLLEEDDNWASVGGSCPTSSSACLDDSSQTGGPMRAAVITKGGRLRLLLMTREPGNANQVQLSWLDLESPSSHKFVSATYCELLSLTTLHRSRTNMASLSVFRLERGTHLRQHG